METFLREQQFQEIFESHIKIETYSKSIDSLFSDRSRRKIDYRPYYQRNYVWDDDKASYFIESILLGTEIPPLIFFEEEAKTEVIDGRQRFETIKRFIDGEFSLSNKGLTSLIDLAKKNVEALREKNSAIYDAFIDAKVRIIGFKLVNNPPSDPVLIDKIKKEIFGRYNSGITPLRTAEIDNAIYDSDDLSSSIKDKLKKDESLQYLITSLFLRPPGANQSPNIENILQFIRKSLVLYKFPIKTYASGKSRKELISKFYEFNYSGEIDPNEIFQNILDRIKVVEEIKNQLVNHGCNPNRLFYECILWSTFVISEEGSDYNNLLSDKAVLALMRTANENSEVFELTDSHYAKETIGRFKLVAELVEELLYISLQPYIQLDKKAKDLLSEVSTGESSYADELGKLESLRITKPDPSRNTIEDLIRSMNKSRFLVRPSYQRSEVINLAKSSAIIESMLLGIILPAIFIYKRKDGVSEVIDGQQRLLTILGFMGKKYLDENEKFSESKNNNFKLRNLRILTDLNGKSFQDLDDTLKDRILEFDLFVVEIEERLNLDFNPVDLFIRLNDKPYPISIHSFEMWNSWAEKNIIDKIKTTVEQNGDWFYLRNIRGDRYRDRMLNEELYTILSYFMYRKSNGDDINSCLDIYQKGGRINSRIKGKKNISNLFISIGQEDGKKSEFIGAIDLLVVFINKVKILLGNGSNDELKNILDGLLFSGSSRKYTTRTLQDIYILWRIIDDIDITFSNREVIFNKIEEIFKYMKNIPESHILNNDGFLHFNTMVLELISENS